jgi:hypothetical protein
MKQIYEAERDKEFAAPVPAFKRRSIQRSFSDGQRSRGRAFPVRLPAYARVASKQNRMEHSERLHLIFSRIHSRVLFL